MMDRKRELGVHIDQPMDLASKRSRSTTDPTTLISDVKPLTAMHQASGASTLDAAPIDLSKKKTTKSALDGQQQQQQEVDSEVITLSDDEEEEIARLAAMEKSMILDETTMREQRRLINKLQESLFNEEAKLMLLKQLRNSQRSQVMEQARSVSRSTPLLGSTGASSVGSAAGSGNQATGAVHRNLGSGVATGAALPAGSGVAVHRGSNQVGTRPSSNNSANTAARTGQTANAMRGTNLSAGGSLSSSSRNSGGGAAATPAPVHISQAQLDTQKAQRKLALRKQLEKSLLDIPSPVPPPPELNFVPSTATNEFVTLVGLEEVVKNIQEYEVLSKGGKPADVKYVFHPFTCVQCRTDFTPVWKRDKPGSKNVICEHCVAKNQKNQIRQEHTNRLKSSFVKALKQEEDIEREFKRYSANPAAAAAAFSYLVQAQSSGSATAHHSSNGASSHRKSAAAAPAHSSLASNATAASKSAAESSSSAAATTAAAAAQAQAVAASMMSLYGRGLNAAEMQRQQQFLQQQMQAALAAGYYRHAAGGSSAAAAAAAYPFNLTAQLPANYMQLLQQAARQSQQQGGTAGLWGSSAGKKK